MAMAEPGQQQENAPEKGDGEASGQANTGESGQITCPACGQIVPFEGLCCPAGGGVLDSSVPPVAQLKVTRSGEVIPITNRWLRIGRDRTNQVVLSADSFASRYHAWVTYDDSKFYLEDLGSTNGTLFNGAPVEGREVLSSGDTIKIGKTEMVFELLEQPDKEPKGH
jgi:hypothetical protein